MTSESRGIKKIPFKGRYIARHGYDSEIVTETHSKAQLLPVIIVIPYKRQVVVVRNQKVSASAARAAVRTRAVQLMMAK